MPSSSKPWTNRRALTLNRLCTRSFSTQLCHVKIVTPGTLSLPILVQSVCSMTMASKRVPRVLCAMHVHMLMHAGLPYRSSPLFAISAAAVWLNDNACRVMMTKEKRKHCRSISSSGSADPLGWCVKRQRLFFFPRVPPTSSESERKTSTLYPRSPLDVSSSNTNANGVLCVQVHDSRSEARTQRGWHDGARASSLHRTSIHEQNTCARCGLQR